MVKSIENIINAQIEKESYSSQLYLAMASWAETAGYEGVSQWLYAQAEEERLHFLKFIHFVNERGGISKIPAIKSPPAKYKNIDEVFREVLIHEEYITASINEIVSLCVKEKDYATHTFLQWFVNEQIEEERNVRVILDKLKLLGPQNLYLFDKDIMAMRAAASTVNNATV